MKPIYTLLLIFASFSASSQQLKWSRDTLLTWNNFKVPVDSATYAATSYLNMTYEYRFLPFEKEGVYRAKFKVTHYFDADKSTTIINKQGADLLKHEQTHFDIAEYFARQLKYAFETYTYTKNIRIEIIDIYQRIDAEREKMQTLYDTQAKHGEDVVMQKKWEEFVAGLLATNPPLNEVLKTEIISGCQP